MDKLDVQLTERFKKNLKKAIEQKGTNPKKLSLDAGLGETAVRDILKERSASPKLETAAKIAKALNTPLSELTGEEQDTDEWVQMHSNALRNLAEKDRDRFDEGMKFLFPDTYKKSDK